MKSEPETLPAGEYPRLEMDYPVRLNQIGPDALVRSHVLFDYLQDAAAAHADILGVGMSGLRELDILWVLSRIKLRMDSFPSAGDTVRVRTWPSGISKLFATRQYELFSVKTGVRLGVASSFWLTLNAESLRPENPVKVLHGRLPTEVDSRSFFPDLGKLSPAEIKDPVRHTARQSHIDFNNHMNNAYYALFTQDYLAALRHSLIRFDEIQINFNQSVRFGESFVCGGSSAGDEFTVSGVSDDGKNVFTAAGRFHEIFAES